MCDNVLTSKSTAFYTGGQVRQPPSISDQIKIWMDGWTATINSMGAVNMSD